MNKFYRIVTEEYLNGDRNNINYTQVYYGDTSKVKLPEDIKIYNYYDLIHLVSFDMHDNLFQDLYTKRHFKHIYLYSYSQSWVEDGQHKAGLINPKKFNSYVIKYSIEELNPTLKEMIDDIPFSEVLKYMRDDKGGKVLLQEVHSFARKL